VSSDSEKNLIFAATVLLVLVVIAGIGMVDNSLTRLIMPERPFATVAVKYQHGLLVQGAEADVYLKAYEIGAITIDQKEICFQTRRFEILVPHSIRVGDINEIRRFAGILTK